MCDAEIQAEHIIAELDTLLLTDILKVGHHGSSTSSIPGMVGLVNLDYAVISAGENNRYGHPSEKVVQ